jgi:hypothetical protein
VSFRATLRADILVLMIDVKGDLPNLLLSFPDFSPAALEPWIEPSPADDRAPADIAAALALERRNALTAWGYAERALRHFRDRADIRVITPGFEIIEERCRDKAPAVNLRRGRSLHYGADRGGRFRRWMTPWRPQRMRSSSAAQRHDLIAAHRTAAAAPVLAAADFRVANERLRRAPLPLSLPDRLGQRLEQRGDALRPAQDGRDLLVDNDRLE